MTSPTPAGPAYTSVCASGVTIPSARVGLTTREAAAYTGISESTLEKRRVYGGGPRFVRAGRSIRYLIADLDAYMDARAYVSTSEYALH